MEEDTRGGWSSVSSAGVRRGGAKNRLKVGAEEELCMKWDQVPGTKTGALSDHSILKLLLRLYLSFSVLLSSSEAQQARLAQSVARETLNLKVVGSSPTSGFLFLHLKWHSLLFWSLRYPWLKFLLVRVGGGRYGTSVGRCPLAHMPAMPTTPATPAWWSFYANHRNFLFL